VVRVADLRQAVHVLIQHAIAPRIVEHRAITGDHRQPPVRRQVDGAPQRRITTILDEHGGQLRLVQGLLDHAALNGLLEIMVLPGQRQPQRQDDDDQRGDERQRR